MVRGDELRILLLNADRIRREVPRAGSSMVNELRDEHVQLHAPRVADTGAATERRVEGVRIALIEHLDGSKPRRDAG